MIWIFEPKHLRKHVITITILNFEREMGRNEKQGEIHFVYKIQKDEERHALPKLAEKDRK